MAVIKIFNLLSFLMLYYNTKVPKIFIYTWKRKSLDDEYIK